MNAVRSISCWLLPAMLFAVSPLAHAAGFQLIEQNASGLGNAYAGQAAAAENASTVFFNPAGMTYLPGVQISATLHGIRPSIRFADSGGSRSPAGAGIPFGGDNGGNAGDWNWIPNFDLTWQLAPRLWAGIGITAPFGLKTQYDPAFIGRFQSQKAHLKTVDINPSLAYRISDAVSVGVGLSRQRASFTLERSFFAGIELPQTIALDDSAWGWNVGAMFDLGPGTRLGVSYRSAMDYRLGGSVTIPGVGSAGAQTSLKLPATMSVGLSHHFDQKWQVLGDVTWTQWGKLRDPQLVLTSAGLGPLPAGSVVDTLDLQFRDTYRVGVGINYHWGSALVLKFGVAYDKTPVPGSTHRLPLVPDSDRTWVAIGAKYRLTKAGVLDFGYAYLFVRNPDIVRNRGVGVAGAQGIVSGAYRESSSTVSVQYSHTF